MSVWEITLCLFHSSFLIIYDDEQSHGCTLVSPGVAGEHLLHDQTALVQQFQQVASSILEKKDILLRVPSNAGIPEAYGERITVHVYSQYVNIYFIFKDKCLILQVL